MEENYEIFFLLIFNSGNPVVYNENGEIGEMKLIIIDLLLNYY